MIQAVVQDDNTWKSCCILMDRRAAVFFSQLGLCGIVVLFCMYQLIHSVSCERDALYSGILTLILGIIIPAPSIRPN
jgi:hypothetical protein